VNGLDVEPQWLWLLAAIALGIAELIAPGVFLIWLAAAAAATGLLTLAFGIDLPFQFAVFALLAIAAVYSGRRWYLANPMPSADPMLNDRAARLVGRTVVVTQAIENGEGRVRVGDGVWSCRGLDAPEGARVRITGADGSCLKVEPVRAIEGPAS
jgi:membrane protein implicated in regulation of membrane protease activity